MIKLRNYIRKWIETSLKGEPKGKKNVSKSNPKDGKLKGKHNARLIELKNTQTQI